MAQVQYFRIIKNDFDMKSGTLGFLNYSIGTFTKVISVDGVQTTCTGYASNGQNLKLNTEYTLKLVFNTAQDTTKLIDFATGNTNDTVYTNNTANIKYYDGAWTDNLNYSCKIMVLNNDYITSTYLTFYPFFSETTKKYSVTETLTNVKGSSTNPTQLIEGNEYTLTYIANDNCEIDTLQASYGNTAISTDKKTATIALTASADLTVICSATDTRKRVTITGVIKNATCNYASGDYLISGQNIKLTPNENYYFPSGTYYVMRDSYATKMTRGTGGSYLEVSPTLTDYNYVLNDTYLAYPKNITLRASGNLTQCTCNYNVGDVVTKGSKITITANEGYSFKGELYVLDLLDVREVATQAYFTKTSSTQLDYTFSSSDNVAYIDLSDNYNATKDVNTITDFAKIYFPTKDEINSLSKERIVTVDTHSYYDYGQYITNLYLLPFTVDSAYKADKDNIVLGSTSANTTATSSQSWIIEKEITPITINGKYSNAYDYIDTKVQLILPFYGVYDIPAEYVIDQTLTINFTMNLYNSKAKYYIKSTLTNNLVDTLSVNVGSKIPIQYNKDSSLNSVYDDNDNYTIDRVYINIIRPTPYYTNSYYGKRVTSYTQIKNITDYLNVEDVTLNTTASVNERDEIIRLLKSGVLVG